MREETAKKILGKVRADYDAIAEHFSETRTKPWPVMERFREFVKAGDRVLDVGCGNGRAYQLFAGMAIEYEGIDVSEELVRRARSLWRDQLVNFRTGSVLALPYEDGDFDALMAVAVLHHVPSERYRLQALREMHRVLKPGGWLLMTNWYWWNPTYIIGNFWRMAKTFFGRILGLTDLDLNDAWRPWKRGPAKVDRYYHDFTVRELRRLCLAVGFEIAEMYVASARDGRKARWLRGSDNIVTLCRRK